MKKKFITAGLSIVVLILLFTLTDPTTAPAFLSIVPFIAFFVLIGSIIMYAGERGNWSRTRSFRVALVGAGVPVVLLVLQSIGQLTIRDLITIGAIFVVLYFYLSRLSFKK